LINNNIFTFRYNYVSLVKKEQLAYYERRLASLCLEAAKVRFL
jgi:hypothetical protein